MNDFKVGDDAWYFNFKVGDDAWFFNFPEDGCGGFDVSAVELKVKWLLTEDYMQPYLYYAYKSKQEAIDAFKKRLDEL